MSAHIIENNRKDAEVFIGAICSKKSQEILKEYSLPSGLLPVDGIEEIGINRSTGFVWVNQKKPSQHRFAKIDKTVSYDTEVTAFIERRRMRKVTGVKSKEFLIWVTLNDISVDDPASGKITFRALTGLTRSFPFSAFQLEDVDNK